MKIESVGIKNFRGYGEETRIYFSDLTVLVGKNDVGKSTILEALDIFLNDGGNIVKIDKSDINVDMLKSGDNETEISVCFSDLPDLITLDSTATTTLADEYMLNCDGYLEVVKKYKNGGKPSVFIRANHPTNPNCSDLLLKKNSELKGIISDNNIECSNLRVNAIMRKSIWKHYRDQLNIQNVEIDASKEDAKRIWDKLSLLMPVYSLFQSDRKNSDSDNEVQDPLREAVKQIINSDSLQRVLLSVSTEVEKNLKEVADRTLKKLREMDPSVADSLSPSIPTADKLKWAEVFKSVSISGDNNIPINKRGSGVKRLILLNFFRAEAERRAEENGDTGVIYAIEEPETSQHPNSQRLLINALKELSSADNTQVILTTHSPIIVKELDFCNLRIIYDGGGKKNVLPVEPAVLRYPSLNEVNYIAYDEAAEEYHDELYGFLELCEWYDDYKNDRPTRKYVRINKDGSTRTQGLDLTEYIRHQIHHPENKNNERFTNKELKQSINDMREYIKKRIEEESKN